MLFIKPTIQTVEKNRKGFGMTIDELIK